MFALMASCSLLSSGLDLIVARALTQLKFREKEDVGRNSGRPAGRSRKLVWASSSSIAFRRKRGRLGGKARDVSCNKLAGRALGRPFARFGSASGRASLVWAHRERAG